MIVVSNTSPIINLAAVDELRMLHDLYDKIYIPEAVFDEISVIGAGQPGSEEVKEFDWIITQKVSNQTLVKALRIELDRGEAEAIALAIELNADLLLIDEKIGRSVATRFDPKFIGLLGTIIEAKSKGLVESVKPILNDLQTKAGFWISRKLYENVLKYAKEQ